MKPAQTETAAHASAFRDMGQTLWSETEESRRHRSGRGSLTPRARRRRSPRLARQISRAGADEREARRVARVPLHQQPAADCAVVPVMRSSGALAERHVIEGPAVPAELRADF